MSTVNEEVKPTGEPSESEARSALVDALAGKTGWRRRARRVLGLEKQVKCLRVKCTKTFPSGGKKKYFCGDLCRQLYDESVDPPKLAAVDATHQQEGTLEK